jgi:hypothetical protein
MPVTWANISRGGKMQAIKTGPGTPKWRNAGRARRATWCSTGALVLSALAVLFFAPMSAGASATGSAAASAKAAWSSPQLHTCWPQARCRPGLGGRPPGTGSYPVSITATWNIPKGSKVSFQPVETNCTLGSVYSGSFTTDSEPFANVIQLMTADQGFPCVFEPTRGWWKVTVTTPNGHSTQVDFVDQQIAPLTYLPVCTAGTPSCVGVPRPAVPLSSVVFSY